MLNHELFSEAVEPVPASRGRPRVHADAAARQRAYRARKGAKSLSVVLDADVAEGLAAYMQRQASDGAGLDLSGVVNRLLRTQLLRKR